jgi:hypothetical protein
MTNLMFFRLESSWKPPYADREGGSTAAKMGRCSPIAIQSRADCTVSREFMIDDDLLFSAASPSTGASCFSCFIPCCTFLKGA